MLPSPSRLLVLACIAVGISGVFSIAAYEYAGALNMQAALGSLSDHLYSNEPSRGPGTSSDGRTSGTGEGGGYNCFNSAECYPEAPLPDDPDGGAGNVTGWIDRVDRDATGAYISGWACQVGVSQPLNLHVYAGGPAGGGGELVMGTTKTNIAHESAISSICQTSGVKHRYKFYIPDDKVTQFEGEEVYVHGIRAEGSTPNALLNNSGTFTIPASGTSEPSAGKVTGRIGGVASDSTGSYVHGWACQEGVNQSIEVRLLAGAPAGQGGMLVTSLGQTNQVSEGAVHSLCDTTVSVPHRFKYYFSDAEIAAHAGEKIYMHGIRAIGTAANALLANSGNYRFPSADGTTANDFNILWHIGVFLEPMADLTPSQTALNNVIDDLQDRVDGYYFLRLSGSSPFSYWPDRPFRCSMTGHTIHRPPTITINGTTYNSADLYQECRNLLNEYLEDYQDAHPAYDHLSLASMHANVMHGQAFQRVLSRLNIESEQDNGKKVLTEMLLTNHDFTYNSTTDDLELSSLPKTVSALEAAGITVENVLAYQEPQIQRKNGTLVEVPRTPGGTDITHLPNNIRMVNMIGDAFTRFGATLQSFSPNVREWFTWMPARMNAIKNSPYLGGVFFEGGTKVLVSQSVENPSQAKIDDFAGGIAWLLEHTDEDIYMLLPGHWSDEDINLQSDRDELDDRVVTLVQQLNAKVNALLRLPAGQNSFCNDRINLIPASYGGPMHVHTFPVTRDGETAGTVGGQIVALDNLRTTLCGS